MNNPIKNIDDYPEPNPYDDDDDLRNGIWRRMFDTCVSFQPEYLKGDGIDHWDYAVIKYPFVPGFHVCHFGEYENHEDEGAEYVLSTHKTLHEAMDIVRVLLAAGGVHYV
jgi:hypothetical protein